MELLAVKTRDGGWHVGEVPMLPACFTQGKTERELEVNLRDVVSRRLADIPDGHAEEDFWYLRMDCVRDYYMSCNSTREAIQGLAEGLACHYRGGKTEASTLLRDAVNGVAKKIENERHPNSELVSLHV